MIELKILLTREAFEMLEGIKNHYRIDGAAADYAALLLNNKIKRCYYRIADRQKERGANIEKVIE